MNRQLRNRIGRLMGATAVIVGMIGGETGSATAASSSLTTSKFVSLAAKNCVSIVDSGGEDFGSELCKGTVDGWSVIVDYDDARDSITLRKAKKDTELRFSETVTSSFASVGDKFEFRVRKGKAIGSIVRVVYQIDSETPEKKKSVLVVSRLSPTPCVIAIVQPGTTQSSIAHSLADSSAGKPCRTSTE